MPEIPVMTVSQLTRHIKNVLEVEFPHVWVSGEISNCTRAASGHCYLTLKDDAAQLRAIIWKNTASRLRFDLQDGLEVMAAGRLEVYEARGSYQMIIETCEPKGMGALELAFRQLRDKLEAEGLFAPEHKKPLPVFPKKIALITSPTSAAVRDMLQVITRRWPTVDLLVVPVPVQGEGAGQKIAAALESVGRMPGVDVVITGRGGGSLEDLWAFNEEVVARAIFACSIPVISAVGHEIDVTIADLVADRRALTPSEAGELVVPLAVEVEAHLERLGERLVTGLRHRATSARSRLDSLATRRIFTHPTERIHEQQQRIDELEARVQRAMSMRLTSARQQLAASAASLDALSPLRVLERGYSITKTAKEGKVLSTPEGVEPGDMLETILSGGRLTSRVESTETINSQDLLK